MFRIQERSNVFKLLAHLKERMSRQAYKHYGMFYIFIFSLLMFLVYAIYGRALGFMHLTKNTVQFIFAAHQIITE